jgi:hypothetical protein
MGGGGAGGGEATGDEAAGGRMFSPLTGESGLTPAATNPREARNWSILLDSGPAAKPGDAAGGGGALGKASAAAVAGSAAGGETGLIS